MNGGTLGRGDLGGGGGAVCPFLVGGGGGVLFIDYYKSTYDQSLNNGYLIWSQAKQIISYGFSFPRPYFVLPWP